MVPGQPGVLLQFNAPDRKSTRLNSSHSQISYAVFCLKKKKTVDTAAPVTTHTSCIAILNSLTLRTPCETGILLGASSWSSISPHTITDSPPTTGSSDI